jgi:hypothetical protein
VSARPFDRGDLASLLQWPLVGFASRCIRRASQVLRRKGVGTQDLPDFLDVAATVFDRATSEGKSNEDIEEVWCRASRWLDGPGAELARAARHLAGAVNQLASDQDGLFIQGADLACNDAYSLAESLQAIDECAAMKSDFELVQRGANPGSRRPALEPSLVRSLGG